MGGRKAAVVVRRPGPLQQLGRLQLSNSWRCIRVGFCVLRKSEYKSYLRMDGRVCPTSKVRPENAKTRQISCDIGVFDGIL